MRNTLRALLAALGACACATIALAEPSAADMEHARHLLSRTILFDGHNDLPWAIRSDKQAPNDIVAYDLRKRTRGQTDIPRLRQGGVGAQFWSVYIPGESPSGHARTQLE
jgi:membrane dipeptidase